MYIDEFDDLFSPIVDLVLLIIVPLIRIDIVSVELFVVVLSLCDLLETVSTDLQHEGVVTHLHLFLNLRMLFGCH